MAICSPSTSLLKHVSVHKTTQLFIVTFSSNMEGLDQLVRADNIFNYSLLLIGNKHKNSFKGSNLSKKMLFVVYGVFAAIYVLQLLLFFSLGSCVRDSKVFVIISACARRLKIIFKKNRKKRVFKRENFFEV